MSTRPYATPYKVINAGNMASSVTSTASLWPNISKVLYAFSWSGTSPVGTVSFQISSDYALNPDGSVANTGTWTTVGVSYGGAIVTTIPVSGNTGSGVIDVMTAANATRVIYTAASGTGSLTVYVNGKVS